jgi:SagB-type dehydrogenase family enzyme
MLMPGGYVYYRKEDPMTAGIEYMRASRPGVQPPSAQSQGVPYPPLELPIPEGVRVTALPEPQDFPTHNLDFKGLIEKRRTLRKYTEDTISLQELAFFLWASQGVERITEKPVTFRTVPSAGSRHAFETYILVNRVDELQPGLYRYAAIEHSLIEVTLDKEINPVLTQACLNQNQIATSAVTFFWMAVVERMIWRYSERGYRYLFLDAGHACQNLYLAAEAAGCGVCAIGAFDDDLLNAAFHVDGETQFVLYAASLGKRGE